MLNSDSKNRTSNHFGVYFSFSLILRLSYAVNWECNGVGFLEQLILKISSSKFISILLAHSHFVLIKKIK